MTKTYYLVGVDAPLPEPLTYLPPENGAQLSPGQSVIVPLGKRKVHGVILSQTPSAPSSFQLRPIIEVNEERPSLSQSHLTWINWLAEYYIHPIGQVLENMFPPLKRKSNRTSKKSPVVNDEVAPSSPPTLTADQMATIHNVQKTEGFQVHLVHGVTGSGKTEIYLHLLSEVLARGQRGLLLVPEISLTPQLLDRFSRRFPGQIAVLHSHLTEREKTTQWWRVVSGERRILIGARSALFCPIPDLGLIVLDEEHEPSYKQDEKLKYHARDASIMLAKQLNIPIVMGSATPSLESWQNALLGKYELHTIAGRVNARPLPEIDVVDLRDEHRQRKDHPSTLPFWLSQKLFDELSSTFAKKEQAALFLNRRGVAQTAQCHACGYVAECPNCSVSLTVHARSHLVCHYCDYTERLQELCPDCKEAQLEPLGIGTERIQEDMQKLFPDIRVARADRDEVQSREELEQLISGMENHEIDLLIGTQMIAKGLDFDHLNLVGLVLADVGFHWPDFRASERSFQLLTQVAGRSGRKTSGRVVIQTYDPSHVSIVYTLRADYRGFSLLELEERRTLLYPPAWRLALFRIQGASEDLSRRAADLVVHRGRLLQQQSAHYSEGLVVLGPAPAPLFKLRGRFRHHVLIKADSPKRLNAFCRQILSDESWIPAGTKVQVDIDPFQML